MRIIDFHTHPVLIRTIVEKEGILEKVREVFYLRTDPEPIDTFLRQMDIAGIEKSVLLPIDCETTHGCRLPSNEAVQSLVDEYPDKFIGFASVDPHKKNAVRSLSEAVESMSLKGLKLSSPLQKFVPSDERMFPIYEKAEELGIPVLFHSGMFWQRTEGLDIARPLLFDKVAVMYPELKIILAHFGFPWVWETAVLAMRHPNVYVDLANVYTTTPHEYYAQLIETLSKRVVESCLEKKILFGSDFPRMEADKMVRALKKLPLQEKTLDRILGENATGILKI